MRRCISLIAALCLLLGLLPFGALGEAPAPLAPGDSGVRVRQMQQRLIELGLMKQGGRRLRACRRRCWPSSSTWRNRGRRWSHRQGDGHPGPPYDDRPSAPCWTWTGAARAAGW